MTAEIQALEVARNEAREEALRHENHEKLEDLRDERVGLKQRLGRRKLAKRQTGDLEARIAELDVEEARLKEGMFAGVEAAQCELTEARRAHAAELVAVEATKLEGLSAAELSAERERLAEVRDSAKRRLRAVVIALSAATAREEAIALVAKMSPAERAAVKAEL